MGGVLSGLGKGIITSSIGKLLQTQGYRVTAIKIDPYINFDAGTMRPTEHGEVWVTPDGGEIDQDLGNYERFLDIEIPKENNITTGKVFYSVITKEREGKYLGKTVSPIPHVTNEIKDKLKEIGEKSKVDFVIVEIGGTVGDYENILFLEAARQLRLENKPVVFVHVTFLPIPLHLGEMKTKPTQHSVRELQRLGIQPDFILCRSDKPMDDIRLEKLSILCNVHPNQVISVPNVDNIYKVPLLLEEQKLTEEILKQLNLKYTPNAEEFIKWKKFIEKVDGLNKEVKVGIVGKYFDTGEFTLKDSYISVIEAIKHAAWNNNVKPDIVWINSKIYEENPDELTNLNNFDAIIVPGGFGSSGVEGKIASIKHVREKKIPYLGLCYGMQLAVVEYARNVCCMKDAHTTEINKETKNPVIDILPEQIETLKNSKYGATMRLGSWPAKLESNTKICELYKNTKISERHRHRYEVNPEFIKILEEKGLVFSGKSPDRVLMEFMELPEHPYFVATQAHPEFNSRPMKPAPMFDGLIKAAIKNNSK